MADFRVSHLKHIYNLARPWEYYGFSVLITTLGLLLAQVTDSSLILRVICANFLACMFIFVINDIEDREYDALDEVKRLRNPLAGGVMQVRHANIFCWLLFTISLLLYLSLTTVTFFYGLSLLLLGFFYSWKKVQLKSKPFLDLVSHGLYFGPLLLLAGFSTSPTVVTYHIVFMCIAVFLLSIIGDINNEIRDHEVDRLSGIRNTATVFDLAKYKKVFSLITLILIAYIFFYVITTLPMFFTVLIGCYSVIHSLYLLYLVKCKRIQVYEYNKRNVLYIGYALVILLYLLTL
jgi:4-hydroxybenzoate polyprenyltransferase